MEQLKLVSQEILPFAEAFDALRAYVEQRQAQGSVTTIDSTEVVPWPRMKKGGIVFDYVVIDCEAGIEQTNRRVTQRVTHLLTVSDGSARGIRVADEIRKVAEKRSDLKTMA